MKRYLIVVAVLMLLSGVALADTVAQGTSTQGHRIRLTTDKCTVASGRSSQAGWGRTYSWVDSGITLTGCGRLDGDTVLIEWLIPGPAIDTRRYSADDFLWIPARR